MARTWQPTRREENHLRQERFDSRVSKEWSWGGAHVACHSDRQRRSGHGNRGANRCTLCARCFARDRQPCRKLWKALTSERSLTR